MTDTIYDCTHCSEQEIELTLSESTDSDDYSPELICPVCGLPGVLVHAGLASNV